MADSLVTKSSFSSPPSSKEVEDAIAKMRQLKRQQAPEDTTDWDSKIEEAKQLYQSNADRNSWISLAQTIGQGMVRLGAAQEGLERGVDMSKLDLGPGYDAAGAEENNLNRYKADLGTIDSAIKRGKDKRDALQASYDQDYSDQAKPVDKEYDFAKYKYGQETDNFQTELRNASSEARAEKSRAAAEDRDERRADIRGDQEEIKSLDKLISENTKKLQAADTLINQYEQDAEGLSNKDRSELSKKFSALSAQGDISPTVIEEAEKSTAKKGRIWGTNPDRPAAAAKLRTEVTSKLKQELDELAARKQAVIDKLRGATPGAEPSGNTPQAPANSPPPPPAGPSKKKTTRAEVQKHADQNFGGDYKKSEAFLLKNNYEIVE